MTVEAQAKVNFTLEVYGKRPDGYHALRSVVFPVSLADTLEIEVTTDGSVSSDTGYADDLCVKAARVLANVGGQRPRSTAESSDLKSLLGARIRVTKRIPAGGGLGGGSADAAAVLRALNGLWGLGYGRERLAEIGAAVGSDVPALVLGGPVLMEGRGERVTPLATSVSGLNLNLVLVHPQCFSSTKEVYAACSPRAADAPSATDAMIAALESGDLKRIAAALENDLQAPAVAQHPEIAAGLEAIRAHGALGALLSGSGSCAFGLMPDRQSAERAAAALNDLGLEAWAVQTVSNNQQPTTNNKIS